MGWKENKNLIFANEKSIKSMLGKTNLSQKSKRKVVEVLYTTFKKHKPRRVGIQTIVYIDDNHKRCTKTIVHSLYASNM